MATQFGNGRIVTDGLVLSLDAADRNSYVSGSLIWNDVSGNGNSGSLINGPVFNSGSGGIIVFDGSNDYVSGSITPLSGSSFSIGCWVKPKVTPNFNTYFGLGTTELSDQSIHLRLTTDTSMRFGMYGDDVDGNIVSATGKWNYFVVTLDNNRLQTIYQNSNFINSRTANSFFIGNNLYSVGAWGLSPSPKEYMNSEISLLHVYNRALSAQEVLQNYNAQKSRFGLK